MLFRHAFPLAGWRTLQGFPFSSLSPAVQSSTASLQLKTNQTENDVLTPRPRSTEEKNILSDRDYFGVSKLFTTQELFDAGVHLGHAPGTLDDRMRQFIFGKRFNQLIIDLDQTAEFLKDALNFTAHIAYREGIILFVCRNRMNGHIVEKAAIAAGEYAHTRYWQGGILTNSTKLFQAVTRLPDLLIFISTQTSVLEPHIAVEQSAKMNIPTVAIVDTNCNPNLVTYPVPGNDDSPSAITLYCKLFKEAILLGKKKKQEHNKVVL